jgi:CubicO group peptidase (beta-lactamase class C family)
VGNQVVLPQRSTKPLSLPKLAATPPAAPAQMLPLQSQQIGKEPQAANSPQPGSENKPVSSVIEPTSLASAFDGNVQRWMASWGVTGVSVAVMRNDRLVFAAGYGDREANDRVDIWSLSKAITALCIASLIKDNKLHLDDPIGPPLAPVFRKFGQPADKRLAQITVAQLLSHRGGFSEFVVDNRFAPGLVQILRERPPKDATVDMLMRPIMKLPLSHAPGAEYHYSNVGYLLLGQIIGALTGQRYETACANRVLAKAGIKRPALDPEWGYVSQASGGWSLSGPEFLGFARLLRAEPSPVLTPETRAFLESADGKWMDQSHVIAYTLGVMLRPVAGSASNIFSIGSWFWRQDDAKGGAINEKKGTLFGLSGDGVAWFASYNGVSSDTEPKAVDELDAALWDARRRASIWPEMDLFPSMGVGPITTSSIESRR